MSEEKIAIGFIAGILLFVAFLVFTAWYFPSARTHLLNFGKQVCTEIKPAQTFRSHMTCKDLE